MCNVMFICAILLMIGIQLFIPLVETARSAKNAEFTFMGWFVNNNIASCTLVVISTTKFSTAAHCFVELCLNNTYKYYIDLNRAKACAGSNKKGSAECKIIKEYRVSPNYFNTSKDLLLSDIAVGYLEEPFGLSEDKIMPIPLVSTNVFRFRESWNNILSTGIACMSMGWNLIEQTNSRPYKIFRSNSLQVSIIRPWKNCSSIWPLYQEELISYGIVCAANTTKETYVTGEEGSALFCQGHVYGVLSRIHMLSKTAPAHFILLDQLFEEFASAANCIGAIKALPLILSILVFIMTLEPSPTDTN